MPRPDYTAKALLSFIYSLLTADVRGALEGAGPDPAVGFLHVDRPGRPNLALDARLDPSHNTTLLVP